MLHVIIDFYGTEPRTNSEGVSSRIYQRFVALSQLSARIALIQLQPSAKGLRPNGATQAGYITYLYIAYLLNPNSHSRTLPLPPTAFQTRTWKVSQIVVTSTVSAAPSFSLLHQLAITDPPSCSVKPQGISRR